MQSYFDLDKQEKQLLNDYELGKLKTVSGLKKLKKLYRQYAENTLKKPRNINIRLSEKDLQRLKSLAAREGIPYQTLAASLIHKATAADPAYL